MTTTQTTRTTGIATLSESMAVSELHLSGKVAAGTDPYEALTVARRAIAEWIAEPPTRSGSWTLAGYIRRVLVVRAS